MTVSHSQHQKIIQGRLERVMLAFFVGCALFAAGVYLIAPSIVTQGLLLSSDPGDRYPLPATLVLIAILLLITVVIIGVLRHWQWLFWLVLIAFGFSILGIPATLLQWAGVLPAFPGPFPLWYSVCRMAVALIEEGIAVWMLIMYRRSGVWGLRGLESKGKTDEGNS